MTQQVKKSGLQMASKWPPPSGLQVVDPAAVGTAGGEVDVTRYGRLDYRHWLDKVFHFRRVRDGHGSLEKNYSVRIQYKEHRYRFDTGKTEKIAAAQTAVRLFKSVIEKGWEATISSHAVTLGKREPLPVMNPRATLGALIEAFMHYSTARSSTKLGYVKAIRKIFADINNIDRSGRHDTKGETYSKWHERIDLLPLASVTSDAVMGWKKAFIATNNERQRRQRMVTVNTLLRNAKALFSKKLLPHIAKQVDLPSPLPLEGVTLESQPSMRYQSKINAATILSEARAHLLEEFPQAYMIVCLALWCGLRRAEIAYLQWSSVDLTRRVIHVESNDFYQTKSHDSEDEVDLDLEFVKELVAHKKKSSGIFVIESDDAPKQHTGSGSYRANEHFTKAINWLREQGITAAKPLHELRKESGSVVASRHGIFEASRFLRHSDIRITATHYLDKKKRIVPCFDPQEKEE